METGPLRGEFIPIMIGEHNYKLLRDMFNSPHRSYIQSGKIVDTPAMNTSLRYQPGQQTKEMKPFLISPMNLEFSVQLKNAMVLEPAGKLNW